MQFKIPKSKLIHRIFAIIRNPIALTLSKVISKNWIWLKLA